MPDGGEYLWDWFEEISDGVTRISDGSVHRITWVDYKAWAELTGNLVTATEWRILIEMDQSHCKALSEELEAARVRMNDEAARRGQR